MTISLSLKNSVLWYGPTEGLKVHDEALAINHIDLDKCKSAPKEDEVLKQLNQLLKKHDFPTIVGFNVQFDLSFIKAIAFRNRMILVGQGMFIDLQQMANFVEGTQKFALKGICDHLGLEVPNHSALQDAKCCVEVAKKVM